MDFKLIVESGESMLASLRVRPTRVICSGTHQRDVKAWSTWAIKSAQQA